MISSDISMMSPEPSSGELKNLRPMTEQNIATTSAAKVAAPTHAIGRVDLPEEGLERVGEPHQP